jgi:hypothetical protein
MNIKSLSLRSVVVAAAFAALSPELMAQGISILPPDGTIDGMNIANGDVHMVHLPALVLYWIQVLLSVAGGFAVVMVMVGGVQYMIGSVSNDKEQGKKTITYAIGGLVLAFFAWWIVELIQVWMTS